MDGVNKVVEENRKEDVVGAASKYPKSYSLIAFSVFKRRNEGLERQRMFVQPTISTNYALWLH
jgi:hypothetical protein